MIYLKYLLKKLTLKLITVLQYIKTAAETWLSLAICYYDIKEKLIQVLAS